MQCTRISGQNGKCWPSTSPAGPENWHPSTRQAIMRRGRALAWLASACAGVPLNGQPLGQWTTWVLKASCSQRCYGGHVVISPILKGCMQFGPGAHFIDDHGGCAADRIKKCCLMQRSQNIWPKRSSLAGRGGRQRQIAHITWLAMPPSIHSSSKPCWNVIEFTSTQASRLGNRGGRRPGELHVAVLLARVVGACFGSFSTITNGAWLDEEEDIEIGN